MDGPPETMADFMEASKKIAALGGGKTGYCLRGGPGATNGYMMMMANEYGSNEWFDKDGNSFLDKPEAVAGLQFLVDMYKNGYVSKDSVNWGFNEIVAGFYSGTCAMLDQDPDALIAVAEKMPKEDFAVAPMPLGPARQVVPDHRLCRLGDVHGQPAQGGSLEADRVAVLAPRAISNGRSSWA